MSTLNDEIVREALAQLDEWQGDRRGIHRSLEITDSEHAELTERIKVVADAMRLRPDLHRAGDHTEIDLGPVDGDMLSTAQIALAARIEAAYRSIAGPTLPAGPERLAQLRVPRIWQRWRRHASGSVADPG